MLSDITSPQLTSSDSGYGVTQIDGGWFAVRGGSRWNNSSDKNGMNGEMRVNPTCKAVYKTLRLKFFASSLSEYMTGFRHSCKKKILISKADTLSRNISI